MSSGAAASLRVLAHGGSSLPWWLYQNSRPLAALAERVYALCAKRRSTCLRLARALWGAERYPARYTRAAALFPRLLGLTYLAAFGSLAVQIEGLLGSRGIAPVGELLAAAERIYGARAWFEIPGLAWLAAGDGVLVGACLAGAAAGGGAGSGSHRGAARAARG